MKKNDKKLTPDELREMIHNGLIADPLVFLASLVDGYDPRKISAVYNYIEKIEDENGLPTQDQWDMLKSLARKYGRFESVGIEVSLSSAKSIAEYTHAKKKEIKNENVNADSSYTPLTKDEVIIFRETWDNEF